MTKISNSALDLYTECSMKYRFRYIDKLEPDITSSALLFGTSLDAGLNHILQSMKDKKEWTRQEAIDEFGKSLEKWEGQNRLDYFKNDVPLELQEGADPNDPELQEKIWEEMYNRGIACIDVYIKDILPQFDEIIEVQKRVELENGEGDLFVGVIDFIAKLKDGRVVLLDNKSSSAKYPKNKVVKSQQLSLYLENFPDIKYAGYCVLLKDPRREKGLTYQLMVDEIPESTKAEAFAKLENALQDIKAGKFECNYKSCMAYGKPCGYEKYCRYGDDTGLVSSKKK